MTEQPQSKYRWYVLGLGVATHVFVVAMSRMCMPVLFQEISEDLGLDLVEIGMIWGIVGLAGVFTAFTYGMICDRFGASRTLGIACLLQGLAGALRGLSGDFSDLAIYTFLFGLFGVPLSFTTHKAAGEWFSGRQLGLANGILAMGMGAGVTFGSLFSATVFSPALGGWRNLMFVYGGIAFAISLLWLLVKRRSTQQGASEPAVTVPFRQSLSHVVRIKAIWLIALSNTCLGGCCMAFIGYLPLYLRGIGWTAISADGALAALSAISVIGCIPLSVLSDRIGLRKAIIYPSYIITIICVGLFSVLSGVMVWPLVLLIGVVREALFAILITMVMETEGVGKTYSGTSLGMISTIGPVGGFFAPPIGNRLALINPSYAFIFWAALAMVGLSIFRFTHETGWRKRPLEN